MSPLKRFFLDVVKAPDLVSQVLIPAVLGNSIWGLGQILLPVLRDPESAPFPWAEIVIVLTIIVYLLVVFVAGTASKYRVDRSPPVMVAITTVEHVVQAVALAVVVIALCPPRSIRTAAWALLVYSVAVTAGHGIKSIYEIRQVRIDSRIAVASLAVMLIGACGFCALYPDERHLLVVAWVFAGTLAIYLIVPWKHHRWRVPRHLAESSRIGDTVQLRYRNRARRNTTITVLAYDPRRLDDRVYVELGLDGDGIGRSDIPWPADAIVVIDFADSYPKTLRP